MKPARVERLPSDLRDAMREQMLLLLSHCEHYDRGERAFAKHIAVALRLLIHQTKNSHSLLEQVNLRNGRFFTVCPRLHPRGLGPECGLVGLRMVRRDGTSSAQYVARTPTLGFRNRMPFLEWWGAPVLRGRDGVTMSRRDVITAVADMDGGAHVDPGLEPTYHKFRTGELLGWEVTNRGIGFGLAGVVQARGEAAPSFMNSPQYACVRTIAHEFLLTMQDYAPSSFPRAYEYEPK